MKRPAFLAAIGASAAAALTAPARAQYRPITPTTFLQQVSIGVNVTLSGPLEKYGTEVARGVQAAIDETNHFTTSLTRAWGMRTYDDRNDAALAATNATVAAADPSVIAIVGNLTGPMTVAALSRYANVNFAVVVPTVTADAVTNRGYHNVFRLPAKDSTSGRLFASTILPEKKGATAIAVALDGDYGYDVARGFVQQAKSDRHDADVLLFPIKSFDPAAAARTVLDRTPGYVFLCGTTAGLGPLVEALRLAGYRGDFGASDGFYNGETIARYAEQLDGAYVASSLPPLDRIPTAVGLLGDFQREVGSITAFSAYGYAAAQVIIAASQRNSSYTRFTLLASMQRSPTFTTLVGQYSFNVYGDPLIPNIFIYTVGKAGFKYARPAIRNGFIV